MKSNAARSVSNARIDYAVPLLLQELLRSLENPCSPTRASVSYAVLSLLVRLIASQSAVFSLWYSRRCYERSRGEMITMLYEKTLSRKVIGNNLKPSPDETRTTELDASAAINSTKSLSNWASMIQRTIKTLPDIFRKAPPVEVIKQPASMGKILNLMR